ncbi:MAG TPA: hypothetical protein DCK99_23625, partial [Blastocatellia bacterium]|nr:hypothetical protein [Blastocatellia bacterium]
LPAWGPRPWAAPQNRVSASKETVPKSLTGFQVSGYLAPHRKTDSYCADFYRAISSAISSAQLSSRNPLRNL